MKHNVFSKSFSYKHRNSREISLYRHAEITKQWSYRDLKQRFLLIWCFCHLVSDQLSLWTRKRAQRHRFSCQPTAERCTRAYFIALCHRCMVQVRIAYQLWEPWAQRCLRYVCFLTQCVKIFFCCNSKLLMIAVKIKFKGKT